MADMVLAEVIAANLFLKHSLIQSLTRPVTAHKAALTARGLIICRQSQRPPQLGLRPQGEQVRPSQITLSGAAGGAGPWR